VQSIKEHFIPNLLNVYHFLPSPDPAWKHTIAADHLQWVGPGATR
jgi:hypothetical protein